MTLPASGHCVSQVDVCGIRSPPTSMTRCGRHGGALYVMYGQTEASSRICVLPPDQLPARLGSVGPPVPGTRLSIGSGAGDGEVGEVVCHSATVMMGYADGAEDLARGDDLRGTAAHRRPGAPRLRRVSVAVGDGRPHRQGVRGPGQPRRGRARQLSRRSHRPPRSPATTGSCCGAKASGPNGSPRSPTWWRGGCASTARRCASPSLTATAATSQREGGLRCSPRPEHGAPSSAARGPLAEHRLTFGEAEVPYLYGTDCVPELADAVLDRLGDVDALLFVVDARCPGTPTAVAAGSPGRCGSRSSRRRRRAAQNPGTVQAIMDDAVARGLTRRSAVVAMGGGMVGNLAGLAAALLYRGIRLVHLPTTPVAAFDSTVSLKQGVNLGAGKNLCGTYFVPTLVACDLALAGHGAARRPAHRAGGDGEERPGRRARVGAEADPGARCPVATSRVRRCGRLLEIGIEAKAPYLRTDPHERREALVFEYGHTAGHAIEFASGGTISHGEAVGLGHARRGRGRPAAPRPERRRRRGTPPAGDAAGAARPDAAAWPTSTAPRSARRPRGRQQARLRPLRAGRGVDGAAGGVGPGAGRRGTGRGTDAGPATGPGAHADPAGRDRDHPSATGEGRGECRMSDSGLSVVIPVRGRVAATRRLLESLRTAIEACPEPVEVIVVDDSGPTRRPIPSAHLRRVGGPLPARPAPRRGQAQRRRGGRQVRPDPVHRLRLPGHPGSVAPTVATLRGAGERVGAVAGPTYVQGVDNPLFRVMSRSRRLNSAFEWPAQASSVGWATTSNLAVRRAAFEAVGGFASRPLTVVGGEDVDLGVRLCEAGYAIVCDPEAVVSHDKSSIESLGTVVRRLVTYGRSGQWLLYVHPRRGRAKLNRISTLAAAALTGAVAAPVSGGVSLLLVPVLGAVLLVYDTSQRLAGDRPGSGALVESAACALLDWAFDLGEFLAAWQLGRPHRLFTGFGWTDDDAFVWHRAPVYRYGS